VQWLDRGASVGGAFGANAPPVSGAVAFANFSCSAAIFFCYSLKYVSTVSLYFTTPETLE